MTKLLSATITCFAVSLFASTSGWATLESPVVRFEKPSHFTATDGTNVQVAAGPYVQCSCTRLRQDGIQDKTIMP